MKLNGFTAVELPRVLSSAAIDSLLIWFYKLPLDGNQTSGWFQFQIEALLLFSIGTLTVAR